jgi:folylpolyglutamate synthase/dihydropteroate synthase
MDHKAALGDTVAEIAEVKAGIMQPGSPVVLARQPQGEAAAAVAATALKKVTSSSSVFVTRRTATQRSCLLKCFCNDGLFSIFSEGLPSFAGL